MRKRRGLSVKGACALFGITKQAYYKSYGRIAERLYRERQICSSLESLRREDPRLGGRKLWLMANSAFDAGWVPGRDRFYKLLERFNLALPRPKPRRTTNSNHRFRKYKNIACGITPIRPNALWVSDITCVDLEEGCCYLHIVTDAYSH